MAVIRSDVVQISFDVQGNELQNLVNDLNRIKGEAGGVTAITGQITSLAAEAKSAASGIGDMAQTVSGLHSAAEGMRQVSNAAQQASDAYRTGLDAARQYGDGLAMATGSADSLNQTASSAQTAARGISDMARELFQAAAAPITEIPEKIRSSATAAQEFAASLKAATADHIASGVGAVKSALDNATAAADESGSAIRGIDVLLGQAVTGAANFASKIKDAATAKLSRVAEDTQKTGKAADTAADGFDEAAQAAKDFGGQSRGIQDVGAAAKDAGNAASNASGGFGAFGSSVMDIAKGMFVFDLIKKGIDAVMSSIDGAMTRLDTTEQFGRVTSTMFKTYTDELGNVVERTPAEVEQMVQATTDATTAIVTDTAYGLGTAMQGVQGLISRGIDSENATAAIQGVADAVAFYADGSDESFSRVSNAMNKMVTSGKVNMQDLNIMMDAGIPALDIYADATGKSIETVRKEMSSGKLQAADFIDTLTGAFNEGGERFPAIAGAAQEAGASWQGTLDNVKAATTRGTAAILEGLENVVTGPADDLPNVRNQILGLGRAFGDFLAVIGGAKSPEQFLESFAKATENLPETFDRLGTAAVQTVQTLGGMLPQVFNMLEPVLVSLLDALVGVVAELPGVVAGMLPQLLESGTSIVLGLVEGVAANLPQFAAALIGVVLAVGDGVIQAIPQIVDTIAGILPIIVSTLVSGIPQLLIVGLDIIQGLADAILSNLPVLVDVGVDALINLVDGLLSALPQVIQAATGIITQLIAGLTAAIPRLIQAALTLVQGLLRGILQNLPLIVQAAVELVTSLVQGLVDMLPEIIEAGLELIGGLVSGLVDNIPMIIDAALSLVMGLVEGVLQNLPLLIDAALNLVLSLVQGLIENVPLLLSGTIELLLGLVQGILDNLPMIVQSAIEIVIALISGLIQALPELVAAVPQLVDAIIDTIFETNWLQVGWDVIKGIGKGLVDGVKGVFGSGEVKQGIDDALGDVSGGAEQAQQAGATTADAYRSGAESVPPYVVPTVDYTPTKTAAEIAGETTGGAYNEGLTSGMSGLTSDAQSLTTGANTALATTQSELTATETKFTSFANVTGQKMTEALTAVQQAAAGITDTLAAVDLTSVGVQMMQGLVEGILSMEAAVIAAAGQVAQSARTATQDAVSIESPSKDLREDGQDYDRGFIAGMEDLKPKIEDTGGSLSLAARDATASVVDVSGAPNMAGNPGSAPAGSPVSGGTPVVNKYEFAFHSHFGGAGASASDRDLERSVKQWILEILLEVLESLERTGPELTEV